MNGNHNINLGRERFGDLKHRKNVRNLSEQELADLREAFRRCYAIADNRGYQHHAGIHGLPLPYYCQHGNTLFLPWHRAYLYFFEKALQEQVPGVTLPYWDWTSERSLEEDMPRPYTERRTPEGDPNPLASAAIMFPDDPEWRTRREPGNPEILADYAEDADDAMQANDFRIFSRALESAHSAIHIYCGGDMSSINYASYDPIFWAHHAFVDKLWADWQRVRPDAFTPNREVVLTPFNMTVGTTVDWRLNLGYDYVADEIFEEFVEESTEEGLEKFNASETQVTLPQHEKAFTDATLEFHNVHQAKESFEARIFINEPDASERTPVYDNPSYAGSFYFFGKGELCTGDEGHCDLPGERKKFDIRPPHHLTPFKMYKNVTGCLKRVGRKKPSVSIKLVCVDKYGKRPRHGIELEGLSLVYRD